MMTPCTGLAPAVTVTGSVNVWLPETIVTDEAPAVLHRIVAVAPLPVTVMPVPLAVYVKVAPATDGLSDAPMATSWPTTQLTDDGFTVSVELGWTTLTSSPHAARLSPATPMAIERQLTSLIR